MCEPVFWRLLVRLRLLIHFRPRVEIGLIEQQQRRVPSTHWPGGARDQPTLPLNTIIDGDRQGMYLRTQLHRQSGGTELSHSLSSTAQTSISPWFGAVIQRLTSVFTNVGTHFVGHRDAFDELIRHIRRATMWLLNTKTARLKFFNQPENIPGGYAILSHVWGEASEEDTFQKVQEAARKCDEDRKHARSRMSVDEIIARQEERIDRLEQIVMSLSTRLEQLLSGMPTPSEGARPSLSTKMIPPHWRASDPRPAAVVQGAHQHDVHLPVTNPRELLSPKIRSFLEQAEARGFAWAWADTCCIDKTSSAELTEAINSMFRYYSLSSLCYVYLEDVFPNDSAMTTDESSEFCRSRWHKRGWTLQELLAPKSILFVASDWTILGNKYELAPALEQATGIPAAVLRFEKDITEMCVAARMSWAALRETTRVEDEAYCLFGLFGINMPTLYGEGRNAFYRLQEEILRTSTDTSLFAWGPRYDGWNTILDKGQLRGLHTMHCSDSSDDHVLFADSPAQFFFCGDYYLDRTLHVNTLLVRLQCSYSDTVR